MKKLEPMRLPPWAPPLVIAAFAVPIVAAFALGGPPAGLAAGALAAATLIVIASRARFLEPIAVAASPRDRYRLLVVALADLDRPSTARAIADLADAGADATGLDADRPEVLVLAPAPTTGLERWASDLEGGRYEAQRRLAVSLAALSAAGADASGRVGDPEPLQATEDALVTFPAQEVAFVTGADAGPEAGRVLEAVRTRLDRPVRSLTTA
jgi:hypothetical protein